MLEKIGLATLGVALVGVFVGAAAMEILHRKYPDLVNKTEEQAKRTVAGLGQKIESAKNAFKEGYVQAS